MNLDYWKQQLGTIPDEVWRTADLETLVLADNGLTSIPDEIGALHHLRMLDLGHNALTSLPATMGDLLGLTDFLYLHDNQLTDLPRELAALPDCIGALTALRELHLRDNALRTLPDAIPRLDSLRQLDLRGNPLETLPRTILDLPWRTGNPACPALGEEHAPRQTRLSVLHLSRRSL